MEKIEIEKVFRDVKRNLTIQAITGLVFAVLFCGLWAISMTQNNIIDIIVASLMIIFNCIWAVTSISKRAKLKGVNELVNKLMETKPENNK